MTKQIKGFCKYCGKEYTKGGILRHLAACKKRKVVLDSENEKRKCGYFQLVISGRYYTSYWLIIEISETATLKDLDKFIRDIWVECCGHLSAFEIDGVQYESCPCTDIFWEVPAKDMNYKLKDVFSVGQIIGYEYDFGSTTELEIKVHNYRIGAWKKEKFILLSRNNPLEIFCGQCGKNKAKWIDARRYYDENPFLCEQCIQEMYMEEDDIEENDIDEFEEYYYNEFLLPVCNSPRMGVCGYEGSSHYPDQFQPDNEKI